ncbi:MAG: tRNA pseudouridine(13) synthase TruD [Planctomycetes bacterium]|nr:tRNA pseudouridine(13) synthase TruD [Planctomycetota bacterium]
MRARVTENLPGVNAQSRRADRLCEEVLAKQPANTGAYFWLKVEKTDLGTTQVRSAIARAVKIDPELVSCAGNRDRQGRCIQWFSVPEAPLDHPGPLRRAGVAGKMRVLELTQSHKPVTAETVERLRWRCTLRGGRAEEGYQRAKAIMDRLRHVGLPNYLPENPGDDGTQAHWGNELLRGVRLPKSVAANVGAGRCLRALQSALFDHHLGSRVADGLLDRVLPGDLMRSVTGGEELVTAVDHAQKRVTTWEATVLGPLFGAGMTPVTGEAAERESATLLDAGLSLAQVQQLHGGRRALRIQPAKALVDFDGDDLVVHCELPEEAAITTLLDELIKPALPDQG